MCITPRDGVKSTQLDGSKRGLGEEKLLNKEKEER